MKMQREAIGASLWYLKRSDSKRGCRMSMKETEEKINKSQVEPKSATQKVYYANQPKIGNKGPSKIRQHINRGLTAFLVIAAGIAFYFMLLRFPNLSDAVSKIIEVLKPVVYGFVIAFLLNPIVKKVDKYLIPVLENKMKKSETAVKISRCIGIFLSEIFLILMVIALCNMLIPELFSSIRNLIFTLPRQLNDWVNGINEVIQGDSTLSKILRSYCPRERTCSRIGFGPDFSVRSMN